MECINFEEAKTRVLENRKRIFVERGVLDIYEYLCDVAEGHGIINYVTIQDFNDFCYFAYNETAFDDFDDYHQWIEMAIVMLLHYAIDYGIPIRKRLLFNSLLALGLKIDTQEQIKK